METINRNNYELAFHIDSNLDESGARNVQAEVQKFVNDIGGAISFTKDIEKTKLSYPIRHQRFSHMGYVRFSLENGEKISELDEHMRLHPPIMRHLLLKLQSDLEKSKDLAKNAKIQENISKRASKKSATKEAESSENIEAQLEDVIGKI